MATYKIPDAYLEGFSRIALLTDQEIDQISAIIKEIPVGSGVKNFQSLLEEKIQDESILGVSSTIFSFGSLLANESRPMEEISLDIAKSFYATQASESKDDIERLTNKLLTIFSNSDALKLTFKAFDLLSKNENIFREAHIITDIRLIFNDSVDDHNRNAVLIHRLKLDSDSDGTSKSAYYSLDSNDLLKLKQQIERAIQKEELIRNNYSSQIPFIEVSD